MSTREEIVSGFYNENREEDRLTRSRHGQLEYATTMAYVHKYAGPGTKVLEIGAGTGRYSLHLYRFMLSCMQTIFKVTGQQERKKTSLKIIR
ncbi:MAG: hypothetical protein IKN95_07590 [Lachnospiraceae bacterium]|nr:hypothetical protein [Lachnospiraceae bacterium]